MDGGIISGLLEGKNAIHGAEGVLAENTCLEVRPVLASHVTAPADQLLSKGVFHIIDASGCFLSAKGEFICEWPNLHDSQALCTRSHP